MTNPILSTATSPWAGLYYAQKHIAPTSVASFTGYPEAYRFVYFNALRLVATGLPTELPLIEGAYSALSTSATTLPNGQIEYACTADPTDIAHSSSLMDWMALLGILPLARSNVAPAASTEWLNLIDKNLQWLLDPAQSAIYKSQQFGYGHRFCGDVLARAFQQYNHPSAANEAALQSSIAALQARILPTGWQIAYYANEPGQLIAPGAEPPAGYTQLASAWGVNPERDHTGFTAQTEGMDLSYQFVGLGFLCMAALLANEAQDSANEAALVNLIQSQKAFLTSRVNPDGTVNTEGSCRIGFEQDLSTPNKTKTFDLGNAITSCNLAYAATLDMAWSAARDSLSGVN